jgi:hypothetical protein
MGVHPFLHSTTLACAKAGTSKSMSVVINTFFIFKEPPNNNYERNKTTVLFLNKIIKTIYNVH